VADYPAVLVIGSSCLVFLACAYFTRAPGGRALAALVSGIAVAGLNIAAYPAAMHGKATAIAGAAIVLAGCGGSSQTTVTLTSTLEITKSVIVTAPPPPSAPKTIMETDGTYRVGTDIVPGTYRSAGTSPEGATDCYWARLSSLNETHIIDSNISTGPQLVIIQSTDRAFLTHGCQPWQKAD
jgi:hypothetical protein